MVRTSQSIRVLGPADVAAALELVGTDPVVTRLPLGDHRMAAVTVVPG